MKKIIIIFLFLYTANIHATLRIDPAFIYFFGDSWTDTGNVAGFGNEFGFPNFSGSFTNGDAWAKPLAEKFGLSAEPGLPLNFSELTPEQQAEVFFNTNYAVGGATTFNMLEQANVLFFGAIQNNFDLSPGLYTIFGGLNDTAVLQPGFTDEDVRNLATTAVNNYGNIIRLLNAVGAVEFLVPTLPNFRPLDSTQLFAEDFNEKIAIELEIIKSEIPNINIIVADLFGLTEDIETNPSNYGITETTEACFDGLNVCSNPDQYISWDSAHPTQVIHDLWAQEAFEALVPIPPAIILFGSVLAGLGFFGIKRNS